MCGRVKGTPLLKVKAQMTEYDPTDGVVCNLDQLYLTLKATQAEVAALSAELDRFICIFTKMEPLRVFKRELYWRLRMYAWKRTKRRKRKGKRKKGECMCTPHA